MIDAERVEDGTDEEDVEISSGAKLGATDRVELGKGLREEKFDLETEAEGLSEVSEILGELEAPSDCETEIDWVSEVEKSEIVGKFEAPSDFNAVMEGVSVAELDTEIAGESEAPKDFDTVVEGVSDGEGEQERDIELENEMD